MIELIIFDFDGVIITGSNEGYFRCYHKALEKVGVRLDSKEEKRRILAWWGKGYKKQLELLLQERPELLPKTIKIYEKCYCSPIFSKKIRLVVGARSALKKLSKKYTLAIASGRIRQTTEESIKKFGLTFFKKIITDDDVKKESDRKPAPYMIKQIMKTFSKNEKETIYVGDAKNDIEMAKNAQVTPITVLTGLLTKKEAERLGVKYIIKDITHLDNLLSSTNITP